jgi:hypothetical protein
VPTDIRLDEFDGNWIVLEGVYLKHTGSDIMLDSPARRAGRHGPHRRALVHDPVDGLTINWANDYTGGVRINDAQVNLRAHVQETPGLPANAEVGDLRLVHRTSQGKLSQFAGEDVSLWLCVPRTGPISAVSLAPRPATWRQVQLGPAVEGTA